jgi:hypothetical protein
MQRSSLIAQETAEGRGRGSVPLSPTHDIQLQLLSLVHISNDDLHFSLRIIIFPSSYSKLLKSGFFVQKRILFAI